PQLWPIYKVLEEAHKPVLFHSGDIGVLPLNDQYTSVNRFDSVFCDFPQMPAILGHAGRIDFSRTAGLLRKHSNVYVDISSVIGRDPNFQTHPLRHLITMVKTWAGAVNRILFGSDMPLYSYEKTLGNLDLLIAELQETPDPVISIDDVVAIRDVNSSAFLNRYQL
ncbi:MAG: amidohydrolase family protein, partial [Varibaculum cambriense]|nr:amidohydrolase family protein [Varibaculum cambriense]